MISRRFSAGQPNPKPTLPIRIRKAVPKGYEVRATTGENATVYIYKDGSDEPIIEWPLKTVECWTQTRDEVEKVVISAIKHYERRKP